MELSESCPISIRNRKAEKDEKPIRQELPTSANLSLLIALQMQKSLRSYDCRDPSPSMKGWTGGAFLAVAAVEASAAPAADASGGFGTTPRKLVSESVLYFFVSLGVFAFEEDVADLRGAFVGLPPVVDTLFSLVSEDFTAGGSWLFAEETSSLVPLVPSTNCGVMRRFFFFALDSSAGAPSDAPAGADAAGSAR